MLNNIRRKKLIYSLLYGAAVAAFVILVFIGQHLLTVRFGLSRQAMLVAALFIITISVRPLGNLLALLTDRLLHQRRYDYMITLKNAAKGMTLITDIRKLLLLITHLVSKKIRVGGCAIYVLDKPAGRYVKEAGRGFQGLNIPKEVGRDSSLVEWLIEKRQPLKYERILSWIKAEKFFPHRLILKRTLEQIRATMESLSGSLCVPCFLRGEMIGFMVMGIKLSGDNYNSDDISLLSTLSDNAAVALENARMYEELSERVERLNRLYEEEHTLFMDAASAFSYAIDTKEGYAHGHALKVADYSIAATKELEEELPYLNFDERFYDTLKIACLLHDVGKIGISDRILKKEAPLTAEEEEDLRRHTMIGEMILYPLKEIKEVFDIIRHHHENYDGTGYPDKLEKDDIPMISRIIAVSNAYDLMTSDRPHRKGISKEKAKEELKAKAGTQFDPVIVKAFVKAV